MAHGGGRGDGSGVDSDGDCHDGNGGSDEEPQEKPQKDVNEILLIICLCIVNPWVGDNSQMLGSVVVQTTILPLCVWEN